MLRCDEEWVGVGREEPGTEEDKDQIMKMVGTGRNFAVLHKGFKKWILQSRSENEYEF